MPKKLFTAVYIDPKTFAKYDEGRIILYPDETVLEGYKRQKREGEDEEPEPITAYQYEGEETDGGYIRECADPSDLHDVANAIIRTRYSMSEEFALQRHYTQEPEKYKEKWDAYYEFASKAAELAKKWLGIEE